MKTNSWQWAKANPDEAARRIRDLERENAEQCVLLGKGGERECALLGKVERLERENAALRQQLTDIKSVLFAVRADLEPADQEPTVLMIGDGIPAALLHAARRKEDKP